MNFKTATLALLTPAVCLAHDGDHGSNWFDALAHLLTEPDHLLGIVAAVLAVGWLVRKVRRSR